MRTNVELYYEPTVILGQLSEGNKSEMTERELAFVCGLIKERRPKKIVEIGVAAGATSSVILNCISMLDLETEVFSIDLSLFYYTDKSKKTGYLIDECMSLLEQRGKEARHTLYAGKYAVDCLETIGGGIDFLILDTIHSLPGEVLDFLACYPLLKQGCVVVLHDITLNHKTKYKMDPALSFATKVLFDMVTADKILDMGEGVFPNIGAFLLTSDTDKYLEDIFSSLTISWQYVPDSEEISLYRNFYGKYYSEEVLQLFDRAVEMNCSSVARRRLYQRERGKAVVNETVKLYRQIANPEIKRIYIYGYGMVAKSLHYMMEECCTGKEICHIVSDGQDISGIDGKEHVQCLSDVEIEIGRDIIIIGVNESLQQEICCELQKKGISEYILLGSDILQFLM